MAFGAVRKPYKAPIKFFADNPTADNQIRWYIVPDDTPIYEGWTVFWPRVDVPPNEANSKFEAEGLGRDVRTFYPGNDVYGFPADHVHGDDDDFQGLSKRKKYYVGDTPPVAPCEGTGIFIRLAIGLFVDEGIMNLCPCCEEVESPEVFDVILDIPEVPELDGQVVNMTQSESGPEGCGWIGSISVGDGILTLEFFSEVDETGPIFGGSMTFTGSEPMQFNAGFVSPSEQTCEPWAFVISAPLFDAGDSTGFTITVRTLTAGPSFETIPIGLAIGLDVMTVTPPVETFGMGFCLGIGVVDTPPTGEMDFGLSLGIECVDLPPTEGLSPALLVGIEVLDG